MKGRRAIGRRFWQGVALAACAVVPALACQFYQPRPRHRYIHIQSFRYGKEPAVIRCNRGDWLHLTFSTRDTAHSFFLEEFDLDVKIQPHAPGDRNPVVAVYRTSEPTAAPRLVRQVVLRAEHPGWRRFVVSKSHYRCHIWCGPMHAFEHGSLIIRPNTLLWAGWGLVAGLPVIGLVSVLSNREGGGGHVATDESGWDVLGAWGWLKRLLRWRGLQYTAIAATSVVFYIVVLAALFGTQMAGRNLGVMLTWVVWMFLLVAVLTPLGGRIWCLVCPLPGLGEICQRGAITGVRLGRGAGVRNRLFGLNWRWPRWLDRDWLPAAILLGMGTFSTALVARPLVSGWLFVGLFLMATVLAVVFPLRAFCVHLCPVKAFVGIYGKAARLALRPAEPAVCASCRVRSCQWGSGRGWACPYGLCVAEIRDNTECGLCAECFKTCPYDNVALRWRPFAHETTMRTAGEAWSAMALLVMATVYCLVHLGPWPRLRDYVNILDKANWDLFAVYAAVVWLAALVGLPALMWGAAWLSRRWGRLEESSGQLTRHWSAPLVPLGLMLWIAFVVPMVLVNWTFVLQSFSDPLGWGWDFLGTANAPWHQIWPAAIPWIQVACVVVGLYYALSNGWRIARRLAGDARRAVAALAPVAGLLLLMAAGWVWFFAD